MAAGRNSPLAGIIDTTDGKVFVKGLPSGHRRVITQDRGAPPPSPGHDLMITEPQAVTDALLQVASG